MIKNGHAIIEPFSSKAINQQGVYEKMNVTGIIAEYNPFHNGHLYQLEKARNDTNADYLIVVMSGNFVQRDAPTLIDKYTRAKIALEN